MTNRSFTNTPLATQTRSGSQPLIQGNFLYLVDQTTPSVTAGMLAVDHKVTGTSGTTFDGFHNQVSMLQQTTPVALTNAVNGQVSDSIDYVLNDAQGSAQLHHLTKLNGTATLVDYQITPCLPVRAAVTFFWTGAVVTLVGAQINVASVARTGAGKYTITFSNALTGLNYIPLLSCVANVGQSPIVFPTDITDATKITIVSLNLANTGFPTTDFRTSLIIFGG